MGSGANARFSGFHAHHRISNSLLITNAGCGLEGLCPLGIFLFSAKLNDFMGKPLFLCAQVVEKVNQGLKIAVVYDLPPGLANCL